MNAPAISRLLEVILWIITVGYAILGFRIWQCQLHLRYRFFFVFLVFRVARSLALSLVPFQRDAYGWIWIGTQPVMWFLYVLVVLELYGLVLENYKGLATLGRWAVTVGLAIALLISALTVGPDLGGYPDSYPILRYCSAIDRTVQSGLVIFLLFITGFLAWYPVAVSRNVLVHCIVYAAYFLSGAAAMLVRNTTIGSELALQMASLGLTSVSLACIVVWVLMLNRKGEEVKVAGRPQWQPEDEKHLIDQLASINASLLRAARK